MNRVLSGFRDKLYWRLAGGLWHCFKKGTSAGPRAFYSLCGGESLLRVGTQQVRRPRPELRCGRCDGLEMQRRGWEESGPATY